MHIGTDRILTILIMTTIALPLTGKAQWESGDNIQQAAEQFVRADIDDQTGNISLRATTPDARLRLRTCSEPLVASYLGRRGGSRVTVKVACEAQSAWKIYVPVSIERFQEIVVVTRNLPSGHTITADDVKLVRRNVTDNAQHFLSSRQQAIGQLIRRAIFAGAPLTDKTVKARDSVIRGRIVTLTAERSGILIRMAGTALGNAAIGQRVTVRNNSSGKVVEGVVSAANEVRVTSF